MPPEMCPGKTWVFVWKMTPEQVGHVGIQVGGEAPGDLNGFYRSFHPQLPVFGPLIVYPVPSLVATSWEEDGEGEAIARGFESGILKPDAIFHSNTLNTVRMKCSINLEIKESKYQLIPGIHPWNFFQRAAEDITYQPTERIEYPKVMRPHRVEKAHNCATFVAEILREGGVSLNHSIFPWKMTPNSVYDQLKIDQHFTRINIDPSTHCDDGHM
jgi:hypothetical protein